MSPRWSASRAARLAAAALALAASASAAPRAPRGTLLDFMLSTPNARPIARHVVVYLPPGYADPANARVRYPLLVLLHGGPGNERDWIVHGHVDQRFDRLIAARRVPPLIAVMPNADGPGRHRRSLYMDSIDGRWPVEGFIVHDLIAWADSTLRVRSDVRGRAIGGLSDGASGAVDFALRRPNLFGAAIGLSGDYDRKPARGLAPVLGPPPGDAARLAAHSPLEYLRATAYEDRGTRVYLACGWFDTVALDALELDRALSEQGISHVCDMRVGGHEWHTWGAALEDALVWIWGPRRPAR